MAVVVVNFNAGERLRACLDAVARQSVSPACVIVVDNASTDGSAAAVGPGGDVRLVRLERNVGFAAANNLAARLADGVRWLALLNPDAVPEPDWLEALLRAAAAHPEFGFFASRLVSARDPARLDGAGDAYHRSGLAWRRLHGCPATTGRRATEVFSACAAAALYPRAALLDLDGFDERYFCFFEDVDLGFRLRAAGLRCRYVPEAVVSHVGGAVTGRGSDFSVYHGHRNLVWTYFKNMPWPLLLLYLPEHLLLNVASVVWFCARGQGRAILRAKRDALLGLPGVLRARRPARAVPLRALWSVMEGGLPRRRSCVERR